MEILAEQQPLHQNKDQIKRVNAHPERDTGQLMNVERHGIDRRNAELRFGVQVNAEREEDQPYAEDQKTENKSFYFYAPFHNKLLQTNLFYFTTRRL